MGSKKNLSFYNMKCLVAVLFVGVASALAEPGYGYYGRGYGYGGYRGGYGGYGYRGYYGKRDADAEAAPAAEADAEPGYGYYGRVYGGYGGYGRGYYGKREVRLPLMLSPAMDTTAV